LPSVGCLISSALVIKRCSVLATRRNRYGDRGSPYLSPRLQLIQGPGQPFTITADLEDARRLSIQSIHLWWKPRAWRTETSPAQFTVSKAFASRVWVQLQAFFSYGRSVQAQVHRRRCRLLIFLSQSLFDECR
jgi:hypothetical protein